VQGVAYGLVRMYQSSAAPFSKGRACRPGGLADERSVPGRQMLWDRTGPAGDGDVPHPRPSAQGVIGV